MKRLDMEIERELRKRLRRKSSVAGWGQQAGFSCDPSALKGREQKGEEGECEHQSDI